MKYLFLLNILMLSVFASGQNNLTETYIDRYKEISISEMNRTGIPASITLAQGLLESNWGRSELAVKSNNHFGIKCSDVWDGDTHYRFDDEYNHLGVKKKSCFREYESAEESYYDHSNFLTDPKKTKRYGFLFSLAPDDYKSWAKGLKKSGYATDPKYAGKLIQIIEKYELHQYDISEPVQILAQVDVPAPSASTPDYYSIHYLNSSKMVLAMGGEKVKDLAKKIGVSSRKIIKNNNNINDKSQILLAGQRVYLEKKKSYYLGKETFHEMQPGQDLATVSDLYGIDEEYLKTINRLKKTDQAEAGNWIALKANKRSSQALASTKPKVREFKKYLVDNSDYLFEKALTPFK
jgi:hypothetical protein